MIPTILFILFTYILIEAVRRIYFHPLSRFPGPKLWAVSRIPYARTLQKGHLTQRTKALHDRYGDVVRIAPNELSFISAPAWQDIYGHHQGRLNFPKNPLWMAPGPDGIHSILSANDADHARYRRLLSHAFSDKALRQQEHMLLSYIDLLMTRLGDQITASGKDFARLDLVRWLNFTTFDIIGDLSLGESFHCLEESRLHEWVSILFTQFKLASIVVSLRFFPGVESALKSLLPKSLSKTREQHAKFADEKINRRLASEDPQRNDFMTYMLRYNDEKGMSVPEIRTTLRTLVVAGSETTATALSGIMSNLLDPDNVDIYRQLQDEIRTAFAHESDIVAGSVDKLPLLNAVIEEGLRVCPPVALGMPRVVPRGGSEVAGHWLPEGTFVSASGYTSNRSPSNFPSKPSTFDPTRWLPSSSSSNNNATATTHPAFNPFSLGPRNCLGRNLAYLEMRLILARLLWTFDVVASRVEGDGWRWEEQKTWILWEKRPLEVEIRRRGG
ncbi:MAG: hypothetical protein LQ344_007593 [Seirophora lacunosa]|nr:MAG: hypothetical protein LQ344_007593 [Seirophora lacunosa]